MNKKCPECNHILDLNISKTGTVKNVNDAVHADVFVTNVFPQSFTINIKLKILLSNIWKNAPNQTQ